MSEHRYAWPALRGDYIRSVIGSVVAAGGAALTFANPYVFGVFAVSTGLFVLFGFRTAWRQRIAFILTPEGLGRRTDLPFAPDAAVRWGALNKLSLRFYSTKRDRSHGWMQMTVAGGGSRISLDSTIDDFDAVARAAATAAVRNGIALRSSTLANLEAIGINTARLGSTPSAGDPPL